MADKPKYPIGTLIRFTHKSYDTGLMGKIVGYKSDYIQVYQPKTTRPSITSNGIKYTWLCRYTDFIVIGQPQRQLLFNFMYEE